MKAQKDTAVCKTFNGETLEGGPYTYEFEWNDYENIGEVDANKDRLTDKEQVKQRNVERKNNARQKALTALLESLGKEKPDLKNSPQMRLRRMADVFVANGETAESARELASAALNIAWAE